MKDPEKKARDNLEEYKREVADKETPFQIAVIETARDSVEHKQVHLGLGWRRRTFVGKSSVPSRK